MCELHENVSWLALVSVAIRLSTCDVNTTNVFAHVILTFESWSSFSSNPNEVSYLQLDVFKVKLATVVADFYQV